MSIDEAIKYYSHLADECRRKAHIERNDYMDLKDLAAEHEQLADWLNELKILREKIQKLLEKQEQTNTQNINSTHTSRPNALESLNILEQAKDDKGCVPMSLVRQAFRNVIEQAVDKSCKTCKHRKLSAWEKPCNRCYFGSGVLKDYYEPYTEEDYD